MGATKSVEFRDYGRLSEPDPDNDGCWRKVRHFTVTTRYVFDSDDEFNRHAEEVHVAVGDGVTLAGELEEIWARCQGEGG